MKLIRGKFVFKIIVIILLFLNLALMARMLGMIYFPGEVSSLEKAKQGAQSVIKYSEDLATSYGVARKSEVKNILAKFIYEIEKANSSEEVASLMVDYGRQVQDIIFREVQNKRINQILKIVNDQKLTQNGNVTISNIEGELKFIDPRNILDDKTKEKLQDLTFNQTIELKIKNKSASLLTTSGIFNQVDYLQTKLASLQRQLKLIKQKAGFEEISGPGIVVKVYDRKDNIESTSIVHDKDVRDIVNELLIGGARGIEVGGQRLTVVSAIRCVGPTILVNNKPIPVNPVVLKAVGNPDVLKSSLDIIKKQLESFAIKMEIMEKDEVTLNKIKEIS